MNRVLTFVFMLVVGLTIMACQGDKSTDNSAATAPAVAPITAPPAAGGGAIAGVEHYICPSGHAGSGGASQGTCSQCGTALVHNQAFHASDPAPAAATGQNPMFQDPNAAPVIAAPPSAEPAQNAAGVWHYTCANGCAGGGAAAGPCAQCGSTLAHNQAYHN